MVPFQTSEGQIFFKGDPHVSLQRVSKSWIAGGWSILGIVLGQLACASSPGGTEPAAGAEPAAAGPAMCVTVEIQNQSVRGVTVWVEWENSAPRRLDRLSINDRDVYQLPFRNAQLNLRFQQEGA